MGICIVIPAFNSTDTIETVVCETLQSGCPLLVVDDGSSDDTAARVEGLPVDIVRHPRNMGKGRALRSGFEWALSKEFSTVLTIDSDGQHDPTAIPLLLETAIKGGFDLLLASRYSQFGEMSGLRRCWNRFGAWCIRKRTGFAIDDSQSGFRVYSSRLLRAVTLECNGYDLEMEILVKAWKYGFSIGSVPVPVRVADGRSTSHYRPVRDTWRICMTFLKYSRLSGSPNAAEP